MNGAEKPADNYKPFPCFTSEKDVDIFFEGEGDNTVRPRPPNIPRGWPPQARRRPPQTPPPQPPASPS